MRTLIIAAAALTLATVQSAASQGKTKTLVAVWAHGDDEGAAAPVLARSAREGAQMYMIVVTDGSQGGTHTSIPRGPALARVRSDELRCAADAFGIHPPIVLGLPDGQLGAYVDDPARLFRLTQQLHQELQRLRPDVLISWGPDGATGHTDHRLVSSIVTQLVRAGAPGIPERLFYASLPVEGMRAMNPSRGEPALLIPQAKYFTLRVPVTTADFEARRRSMACHKTQYSADVIQRIIEPTRRAWNGVLPLIPAVPSDGGADLFGPSR